MPARSSTLNVEPSAQMCTQTKKTHAHTCVCMYVCAHVYIYTNSHQKRLELVPHAFDGSLFEVVHLLNERYNMGTKKTSTDPSYYRSGVFVRVGLMEIDLKRRSWINHRSTGTPERFTTHRQTFARHQNVSSFSFLRSDIWSKGLYGKGKTSPRVGTIMPNHLFGKDNMFEILCTFPTDGGSIAREDSGCGRPNTPGLAYQYDGQCSRLEPVISNPEAWIARMDTGCRDTCNSCHKPTCNPHRCQDFFYRISKQCSISEEEFDSLFVPLAQQLVIRNEHFKDATACDLWRLEWPTHNEVVVRLPPVVLLEKFPVEAFFHVCGEPPSATLIQTIAEYKRVLGLHHVPLVCLRMVQDGFFADGASPFEPSPYYIDYADTNGFPSSDNDTLSKRPPKRVPAPLLTQAPAPSPTCGPNASPAQVSTLKQTPNQADSAMAQQIDVAWVATMLHDLDNLNVPDGEGVCIPTSREYGGNWEVSSFCLIHLKPILGHNYELHTGRIGSRRHLAENPWLVSLGCSGGAQRSCRVHLHIIQRWLQGKPLF